MIVPKYYQSKVMPSDSNSSPLLIKLSAQSPFYRKKSIMSADYDDYQLKWSGPKLRLLLTQRNHNFFCSQFTLPTPLIFCTFSIFSSSSRHHSTLFVILLNAVISLAPPSLLDTLDHSKSVVNSLSLVGC